MEALKTVVRAIDRISTWVGIGVSPLMAIMVAVMAFEVVARYVFDKPTIWAYDTTVFLYGYVSLLGGTYALKRHAHINVDVLYVKFGRRGQAIMDVISGLMCFFFLALLIRTCWWEAMMSLSINEHTSTEWGPPVAHLKLMFPLAGALMLLQGFANWIRSLYRAITDKELEP